jgi:hypothetical protein
MLFRRSFLWRALRVVALSSALVVTIALTFIGFYGLPAPPAITTQGASRVSWKWAWRSLGHVRRLQASRRFAAWLPGGRGLLVLVGTPGAVHVVDRPGAAPKRLEGLPDRARYLVQSRIVERSYFAYSLDEGGSERYTHHLFDLETGSHQALTTTSARSYIGSFDGEGRRIIYASTRRNQEDFDLYVLDVRNPASDMADGRGDSQGRGNSHVCGGRE